MAIRFHNLLRPQLRRVSAILLILALGTTSQGQTVTHRMIQVHRGQVLEMSLLEALDSARVQAGNDISLRLTHSLVAEGVTIVPADSIVHSRVKKVTRAGKNCKQGRIEWKLESLETPHGQKIKLRPIDEYTAKPQGTLEDRVVLRSAREKIGQGVKSTSVLMVELPLFIIFFPVLIQLNEGGCDHEEGNQELIPAGTYFYFAVDKDSRVTTQ